MNKKEEGVRVSKDVEKAKYWYRQAALQGHDMAIGKCKALNAITE